MRDELAQYSRYVSARGLSVQKCLSGGRFAHRIALSTRALASSDVRA